jgi:hypothetical protein
MARTYALILNVSTDDSPHPTQLDVTGGLTESAAIEICLTLNEGGHLREGVSVHYVGED